MVNKTQYRESAMEPPPLDESWWEAVLAEDEARHVPSPQVVDEPTGDDQLEDIDGPSTDLSEVDWDKAVSIYQHDEVVYLSVYGHNRGGLLVSGDGLQGFVPISHLVDAPHELNFVEAEEWMEGYTNSNLRLKIIECATDRGRVVFSERAAQAESGARNHLLQSLAESDCIPGVVTNITDFGIFVDLGGVEGLVHVSEISWGRVHHPGDVVKVGQRVTVYVISVDPERARVALSLKRLCDNPWETASQRYIPGQRVQATVTSVVPYGAFARLEEGLDGLIHISEMDCDGGSLRPVDILEEGQQIQVRILHVDGTRQRLGLSLYLEGPED